MRKSIADQIMEHLMVYRAQLLAEALPLHYCVWDVQSYNGQIMLGRFPTHGQAVAYAKTEEVRVAVEGKITITLEGWDG